MTNQQSNGAMEYCPFCGRKLKEKLSNPVKIVGFDSLTGNPEYILGGFSIPSTEIKGIVKLFCPSFMCRIKNYLPFMIHTDYYRLPSGEIICVNQSVIGR